MQDVISPHFPFLILGVASRTVRHTVITLFQSHALISGIQLPITLACHCIGEMLAYIPYLPRLQH